MSLMDQIVQVPRALQGQRIAVSTAGNKTALSTVMAKSGWIRVVAEGCNVDILFGDSTVSAPTFAATGSDATVGYPVKNGTYHDFWITANETYVAWDADASGTIYLCRAGQERVKT